MADTSPRWECLAWRAMQHADLMLRQWRQSLRLDLNPKRSVRLTEDPGLPRFLRAQPCTELFKCEGTWVATNSTESSDLRGADGRPRILVFDNPFADDDPDQFCDDFELPLPAQVREACLALAMPCPAELLNGPLADPCRTALTSWSYFLPSVSV